MVHISKNNTKPANEQEEINDPLIKEAADLCIEWKHIGEGDLKKALGSKVTRALGKLVVK